MNASYVIHADQGYVTITLKGSVTQRMLLEHIQTVWSDPAWKPSYNGIVDFSAATLDMTLGQIEELSKAMETDPRCSMARWALIVSTAASFAKLRHFDRVMDDKATLRIFFDLPSAMNWLLAPRANPPVKTAEPR